MVSTAREDEVADRASSALQPSRDARPSRFQQLELHGPAGLLLHHDRACADLATANEISNPNLHHIATAQLAVDGKIEQCPIT
jgi:hypothetical protein